MTGLPKNIPADTHQERAAWRTSRDRVLLYLRGLDLPPFEDLDLAAASLRACGACEEPAAEGLGSPSPVEAMESLFNLLEEQRPEGLLGMRRIPSCPSLNRGVMVAEPMDRVPWKTAFVRWMRRWRRELFAREGAR